MFLIRSQNGRTHLLNTAADIARATIERHQWQLALCRELAELAMDLARRAALLEAEAASTPSQAASQPKTLRSAPAALGAETETTPQPTAARGTFKHYSQIVLQCLTMASKIGAELDRAQHYLIKLEAWTAPKTPPKQPVATPQPALRPHTENPFPSLMESLTAELAARPPPT